jgi:hypothetical protein
MLPWFLAGWPHLVACLWDPNPQLPAAVAPLLGMVGGLVASSRAAAAAAAAADGAGPSITTAGSAAAAVAEATTFTTPVPAGKPQLQQQPQQQPTPLSNMPAAPPVPPAGLLFDWLLPLLTGRVPLPTGSPAPLQLQVLICKTLIYALQQLPSCTPAEANTAAAAAAAASAVAGSNPPGDAAGSSITSTAQPATPATPAASSATGHPALLVVPVPEAAAQQLRQHGSAVLAAVQELLEGATTPPQLLAPLLQLLLEVIRLDVSVITGEGATAHMHAWCCRPCPDRRGSNVHKQLECAQAAGMCTSSWNVHTQLECAQVAYLWTSSCSSAGVLSVLPWLVIAFLQAEDAQHCRSGQQRAQSTSAFPP